MGDGEVTLGSGSIEAGGAFAYELPETVEAEALEPIADAFCEGLAFSSAALVFSVDVMDGENDLGFITQATHEGTATGFDLQGGAVIVRRVYADRDVTVAGSCDFSPDSYDLTLSEGWNLGLEGFETARG